MGVCWWSNGETNIRIKGPFIFDRLNLFCCGLWRKIVPWKILLDKDWSQSPFWAFEFQVLKLKMINIFLQIILHCICGENSDYELWCKYRNFKFGSRLFWRFWSTDIVFNTINFKLFWMSNYLCTGYPNELRTVIRNCKNCI